MSIRKSLTEAKRVVVKLGTNVVMGADGLPDRERLLEVVAQIAALRAEGVDVLLVSSGAVGVGARRLGRKTTPNTTVDRQACAAVGQGIIVSLYCELLSQHGCQGAQVLLTEADFAHRATFLNLHHALQRLLEQGVIPIINENDTVSVSELACEKGEVFGDNDRLSALVASRLQADLLVLLTDVDGVLTAPPGEPGSRVVSLLDEDQIVTIGEGNGVGRGGMRSKIRAGRIAASGGVAAVIANGLDKATLQRVRNGEDVGTLIAPRACLNSRKHWLAFSTSMKGMIVVNNGAKDAIAGRRASLLPAGVVATSGQFEAGDVVQVVDEDQTAFARGIARYSAARVEEIMGAHSSDMAGTGRDRFIIASEDLVILEESTQ